MDQMKLLCSKVPFLEVSRTLRTTSWPEGPPRLCVYTMLGPDNGKVRSTPFLVLSFYATRAGRLGCLVSVASSRVTERAYNGDERHRCSPIAPGSLRQFVV